VDAFRWEDEARAKLSGYLAMAAGWAGAGDVPQTPACEATDWVTTLGDAVICGEASEAAAGEPIYRSVVGDHLGRRWEAHP
jgi:hypothetical protein